MSQEKVYEIVFHQKGKNTLTQDTVIGENQAEALRACKMNNPDVDIEKCLINISEADPIKVIKRMQLMLDAQH